MTSTTQGKLATPHLLAILTAVFAWGIGPVLTLATSFSINAVIFYRVMFWPPVLVAVMVLRKVPIQWIAIKAALVPGLFFGFSTITGFLAFRETSIANATVIGSVSSALALFIAPRFLGERVTLVQVFCATSSFIGVAAVVFGSGGTGGATLWGDALALINAFLWTGYFLVGKRARVDGVNTWSFLFGVSVTQLIVVVPWTLFTADDLWNPSIRDLSFVMLMVLLPGTIGHGLMVWCQRFVSAGTISLFSLLGPVVSMFFAWLFFAQGVAPIQLLGAAVVLGSLAGVVRYGEQFTTS